MNEDNVKTKESKNPILSSGIFVYTASGEPAVPKRPSFLACQGHFI